MKGNLLSYLFVLVFPATLCLGARDPSLYNRNEETYKFEFQPISLEKWKELKTELLEKKTLLETNELICAIPKVLNPKEKPTQEKEALDLVELFSGLKRSCLYKYEYWWIYEFCFGKSVRQFRKDNLGILHVDNILGTAPETHLFTENDGYASITYTNGSPCEIVDTNRTVEIRFFCSLETTNLIVDIKEPSTCRYVLRIETSSLCQHPKYNPKVSDEDILCYKILETEDSSALDLEELRQDMEDLQKRYILSGSVRYLIHPTESNIPKILKQIFDNSLDNSGEEEAISELSNAVSSISHHRLKTREYKDSRTVHVQSQIHFETQRFRLNQNPNQNQHPNRRKKLA